MDNAMTNAVEISESLQRSGGPSLKLLENQCYRIGMLAELQIFDGRLVAPGNETPSAPASPTSRCCRRPAATHRSAS